MYATLCLVYGRGFCYSYIVYLEGVASNTPKHSTNSGGTTQLPRHTENSLSIDSLSKAEFTRLGKISLVSKFNIYNVLTTYHTVCH